MPQLRAQLIAIVVGAINQTATNPDLFHRIGDKSADSKEQRRTWQAFERNAVSHGEEHENQCKSDRTQGWQPEPGADCLREYEIHRRHKRQPYQPSEPR